ncbi:magnesium-dependent phosphatase 1 [Mytilus galloprovincialis]|uniref:Magnesium-dependent phosphatase 1 n=1 Tax=Mytilus galloprovincialis TaxID=29158 RepID=A0A8B6GUD2_MYTGA|nr:magnesium-dependent phosphatase 1 [Mytilus galloprovincialis]
MDSKPKPKLIVFDLDYTLWPFRVDRKNNVEPPFNRTPDGKVFDANSREIKSFPDIDHILYRLHDEGYKLAIASEAFYKDETRRLVSYFGWDEYFDYIEIYPGSKITHFLQIKKESGIEFPDMMFFDDERDHLSEVAHTCLCMFFDDERDHLSEVAHTCLGVTCIWANRGVSEEILDEAFQAFVNNHSDNINTSTLSINSVDSDESQSETTVIYCHRRRGSRASIQYDVPPVIDRAIRLRGRRMSAPALSINLKDNKKMFACPEIIEN